MAIKMKKIIFVCMLITRAEFVRFWKKYVLKIILKIVLLFICRAKDTWICDENYYGSSTGH